MTYDIRPAYPSDAKQVAPLIYSSGPRAFEYIFSIDRPLACLAFLEEAFAGQKNMFSYQHHYVVEEEGKILGVMAIFTRASMSKTQFSTAMKMLKFMGVLNGVRSMVRGLIFEKKLVNPPLKDCCYIAHVGVNAQCRSKGIGQQMIHFAQKQAQLMGFEKMSLDVSVINTRAQRLYERLSFKVIEERSRYRPELDCHRYMEAPINI